MIRGYFTPLRVVSLNDSVSRYRPTRRPSGSVTLESLSMDVMTDLRRVPAETIVPETSIEEANTRMIHQGIHLLLVTDGHYHPLGIITAADILGGQVIQIMLTRGFSRHEGNSRLKLSGSSTVTNVVRLLTGNLPSVYVIELDEYKSGVRY